MLLVVVATKPEETMELGRALGKLLLPGDLLNLNGDLGAGKTLFAKGVGMGLGFAPDEGGRHPFYHFDLYRLEDDLDLEQVGYMDYFYGSGITIVEWGDLFRHYLPDERLDIDLESIGPEERKIFLAGQGRRGEQVEEQLRGLF